MFCGKKYQTWVVAAQHYDTDINKEYVIRNNAAILKCVLPSYLSDYLTVVSWKIDDEEMTYNDQQYGSLRQRQTSPDSSPLIISCVMPFEMNLQVSQNSTATFHSFPPQNPIQKSRTSITSRRCSRSTLSKAMRSWSGARSRRSSQTSRESKLGWEAMARNLNTKERISILVNFDEAVAEAANLLSHLSTLLFTLYTNYALWTKSNHLLVINQYYNPGLMEDEYVMRNNAAILRCSIPSFVADFVYVAAWVDSDGEEYVPSNNSNNFSGSKAHRRQKSFPSSFYVLIYFPTIRNWVHG